MKYEPINCNQFYHIYNRGNNGGNIFFEYINYPFFLNLIKRHVLPIADIYSYCLLKNHFHILIKTKDIPIEIKLSQGISNLFNSYAKALNKSYNRTGSLFQTRFSRKKISNEKYLKSLIMYIHLNPNHHGFVSDFRTYSHSSYKALISDRCTDKALISDRCTELRRQEVLYLFECLDNFMDCHLNKQNMIDNLNDGYRLE